MTLGTIAAVTDKIGLLLFIGHRETYVIACATCSGVAWAPEKLTVVACLGSWRECATL